MKRFRSLLLGCMLTCCISLYAQQLTVASIFTDNMVLQQESFVPIWGKASKGTIVTVFTSWNRKNYTATADNRGQWRVKVQTPKASFTSYEVKISGKETILLKDVLIGDVWLTSGQSNMSMPLKGYFCQPVKGSNEEIINSGDKKITFINIPGMAAYTPIDTFSAVWNKASIETAANCSAVAWFFAAKVQKHINIPIGIINASYGGSIVEAWMKRDICKQFKDINLPEESNETSPWIGNVPTVLYNGMINPIAGYNIKGMLWYQGESNIFSDVRQYASWVAAMVDDWRRTWDCGEFPFYFAQITPFDYLTWNIDWFVPQWPEVSAYIREQQVKSQDLIPNSAMSVNLDLGHETQVHPSRKNEVGNRLALLALSKTYGIKGFEAESPEYDHMEVEGEKAIIHFKKQFNGLTSFEKKLEHFEMASANKISQKDEEYIDEGKGTIVVTCKLVKEPKAVRYAFKNWVVGDLYGTGGLPVSSFRTDDWE